MIESVDSRTGRPWCRRSINLHTYRIRSIKVKPVPEAFVQAVLPVVSAPVRAMIELQLLAGMRPGEVVIMRAIDLDMTGPIWLYRPGSDQETGIHKTAWRDHERIIAIGPRAQEIIKRKPAWMPLASCSGTRAHRSPKSTPSWT
jgi:integrase